MASKPTANLQVDNLDLQILSLLMNDAFLPYTEIARKLIVSSGTVHVRMNKLEKAGVISGTHLIINPQKIGFDICAFIGVFLDKGSHYNEAAKAFKLIPEIVELHYTTGLYSMFAKIVCRDTNHLREVLNEKIQNVKGIHRTETFISLEESFRRQIKLSK